MKITYYDTTIDFKVSEILPYLFGLKKVFLIGIILFLFLIIGDLFLFYKLGFTILDYFNLLFNEYIFKSLGVLFLVFGIMFLVIYGINYCIKDTVSDINFDKININNTKEYLYRKKIFRRLFRTIFFLTCHFLFSFLVCLFFSSFEWLKSAFLIFLTLSMLNLLFISYTYKKLFEIDNNFENINASKVIAINSNNFLVIFVSIVVALSLLSFIIGFIGHFIRDIVVIYLYISEVIVTLFIFALIIFNMIIEFKFLSNLKPNKEQSNSKINKNLVSGFIIIAVFYFFYITNTNSFTNKVLTDNSSFIDFSVNLMLNKGLIQKNNQPFDIESKKTNLIIENITIPPNNDTYVSSYIEINKEQFFYFVGNKQTLVLDIYLVTKEKEKNILVKKVTKSINLE